MCVVCAGYSESDEDMNEAYNMDCMGAMKQMPDKYFDLAVVDPPYGIGVMRPAKKQNRSKNKNVKVSVGGGSRSTLKSYHPFDDTKLPDAEYFSELKRVSKNQIIWGGNYFLDLLPEERATQCIIVWDKCRRGMAFADCELAWTSFQQPSRIFTFKWNGMLQGDMKHKEERIHPTQKPVALYRWIYEHYAKSGDKILDTHLGSQSSRIAAYERNLDFIGFEIDKEYYRLGCERFEKSIAQQNLFCGE